MFHRENQARTVSRVRQDHKVLKVTQDAMVQQVFRDLRVSPDQQEKGVHQALPDLLDSL